MIPLRKTLTSHKTAGYFITSCTTKEKKKQTTVIKTY